MSMLLSAFTSDLTEAGLDEAGRGCLAGPVVAAAVILPKDYTHHLLTDSKQLTALARERLEEEIKKDALAYAVCEVSPAIIDEINILRSSFLAMHHAVDALTVKPELLLVDGNRFTPYPYIPHQCIVKGDGKFLSIAAASVLAKVHRDRLMHRLALEFPGYLWEQNAGYPTKAHKAAIARLGLTAHHRLTFRWQQVINSLSE